ncbi:uncharacterized mitochondrial protein AtMg00810-like [Hibiscus syriacus]|uniref:uncharacterized mitochondrial protein AtMg00810-like n=1 Tax=Hibiscus syriacus TaxID=106335 RepID=UPI0019208436|nr:uncharacterized mitochondrial protein AtMg00810-like [Hibiscus syriacus]
MEPQSVSATSTNDNWKKEMQTEYQALVRNKTWHLVPRLQSILWLKASNDKELIQAFIHKLNKIFALKDMGSLHNFLGIKVHRDETGVLQYLTRTRPNIAYTINKRRQFLQQPTMVYWQAIKRVFRYLSGTAHVGLHIKYNERLHSSGFSDVDWDSCPDDRRSIIGSRVYFGDTLISWSSKML